MLLGAWESHGHLSSFELLGFAAGRHRRRRSLPVVRLALLARGVRLSSGPPSGAFTLVRLGYGVLVLRLSGDGGLENRPVKSTYQVTGLGATVV